MGGTSSASATSLMVRKASGDLSMAALTVCSCLLPSSTRSFMMCEGRNDQDAARLDRHFLAGLGIAPTRAALSRTLKVPKEEIFTVSPRTSASDMWSSTLSTSSAHFVAGEADLAEHRFAQFHPGQSLLAHRSSPHVAHLCELTQGDFEASQ